MRTIIIISLVIALPAILLAQQTYVPDDYFEQFLINWGYDTSPQNDSVPTANIDTLAELYVNGRYISDLTGIEDFTALVTLHCDGNNLTSLDLSNNSALVVLLCSGNELNSLDVSNSSALKYLYCSENNLASLNVINNSALEILSCDSNQLTSLNVINNSALLGLFCSGNKLTSLNIKNGNNKNLSDVRPGYHFVARNNPDLYCIQVDDSDWSEINVQWQKDDHAVYSEDCGYTGIDFHVEDATDNISISSSPNPFSNSTMINYKLAIPGNVVLNVYDVFGNEVATLLNEFKDAGEHKAQFNAGILPQGIYFYKIQIDNAIKSGHLLLIK